MRMAKSWVTLIRPSSNPVERFMNTSQSGAMSTRDSHAGSAFDAGDGASHEPSLGRASTEHARRWAHALMCLPAFLVIGALVVAGSVAGFSGLLWVSGCMAMMATMWLFMKAFDH